MILKISLIPPFFKTRTLILGGKYGSFGGYDIILVKTHLPMDLNAPVNYI